MTVHGKSIGKRIVYSGIIKHCDISRNGFVLLIYVSCITFFLYLALCFLSIPYFPTSSPYFRLKFKIQFVTSIILLKSIFSEIVVRNIALIINNQLEIILIEYPLSSREFGGSVLKYVLIMNSNVSSC